MKMTEKQLYKTEGYTGDNNLTFYPYPSSCGSIDDGVAFEHNDEGLWVLSFTALQDMYLAAREVREQPGVLFIRKATAASKRAEAEKAVRRETDK